jgi:rubrerythrin
MEKIHSLLLQAIAGESAAEKKYRECAKRALAEGYSQIAVLFTALSRAEAIHAANHQRALEKNSYTGSLVEPELSSAKTSTRENLETAMKAEKQEHDEMYPSFRREISKIYGKDFNAKIALLSIRWASESEAEHYLLLKAALVALNAGNDVRGGSYYLCSVCGNIHFSARFPEELCKVCGHDISFFSCIEGDA